MERGDRNDGRPHTSDHDGDQESNMESESHTTETEHEDGGIGLDDDGKSGKIKPFYAFSPRCIR